MKKLLTILMATLLIAMICVPLTASAADTNILEGKAYTAALGEGASWRLGDDGKPDNFSDGAECVLQKLTDGVQIEGPDGGVGTIGAVAGGLVTYVIPLGDEYTISSFTLDQYSFSEWGISVPVSFEYLVSTDGENYTSAGVVTTEQAVKTSADEAWFRYDFTLTLETPVDAKFVKIEANGGNYVWASEIMAMGSLKSGGGETSNDETTAVSSNSDAASSKTDSSNASQAPGTGDAGFAAIVIISVISVSAVMTFKKRR